MSQNLNELKKENKQIKLQFRNNNSNAPVYAASPAPQAVLP